MPSHNRKTDTADRPSLKARAASLRARAVRVTPAVEAGTASQPVPTTGEPNSALASLIAEHRALLASHNDEHHPDAVADVLFDRAYARFREACAIPAASLADLRAKFDMVEPELREAVEALGSLATGALDSLSADVARLHPSSQILKAHPTADYGALPDPRPLTAGLNLTALSNRNLYALHDVAETLGGVACALVCQPRCSGDAPAGELTQAGHFAEWVHELACQVVTASHEEGLRRPAGAKDEEYRLRAIAQDIVSNGGAAEIRALARDLEAQARRIEANG